MSGHSKWHSIKHKKGAADAKRGKIFTKHAKLITIAARGGGDPEMNPTLRTAIANAKAENVPNANIDKAIKKGTGEDKDAAQLLEITYEGMGPEGAAFMVEVITDNKNRSVTAVKTAITKNGGNMGSSGSAAWMFERKGVIVVSGEGKDTEEAELEIIDAGAEDLELVKDSDDDPGKFHVTTAMTDLMEVRDKLETAGFKIEKAELAYVANDQIEIDDVTAAKTLMKIVDALEEEEDVSNVFTNFDFTDEVLEGLE